VSPSDPPPVSAAVTDHAVERFRQRVSGGGGALDVRPEIVKRVLRAWAAGQGTETPPEGASPQRGTVWVTYLDRRDLVYVCRWDRPRGELLVITLWEQGEQAAVPRRFTDELRRMDRRRGLRPEKPGD
jgi:hypothetical protein